MEAVKTYKTNPFFMLGDVKIPTWITPLVLVVFVSVLVPNTSLLGHLCGLLFGYGCNLPLPISSNQQAYRRLRGPRVPEIPCTSREDTEMVRRKDESAWKTTTLRFSRPEDLWPFRRPSDNHSNTCRTCGEWDRFGICWEYLTFRAVSDAWFMF